MLPLDNATTIYLTGLIAISFAAIQLILLKKIGRSVQLWSLGSLLVGLGYILTMSQTTNSLPSIVLVGSIAVLLGNLITLSALGIWAGYEIPKKPSLICLGGVVVTGTLFYFSYLFNAPLGSLEAILLAPIAATLIYSAWFSGVQAKFRHSKYIFLISVVLWIQGLLMGILTLGALAALGDQYIVVTSQVVYWTSLIYFIATLINNVAWSLQISEDMLLKKGTTKASFESLNIKNLFKTKNEKSVINKEDKPIKEKKIINRSDSALNSPVNPDLLSETEKLALLESLTDKERDVFFLVADGKKNGEIATLLNSSEASVKVHRSRMTGKLGMKKPEELKKLTTTSGSLIESKEDQTSLPKSGEAQDLFTKS
jgi:DNA-binding CsgD family transcriptional regulator